MQEKNTISTFLGNVPFSKEPGCIIAASESERQQFETELQATGFQKIHGVVDLATAVNNGEKGYVLIEDSFAHVLYEFLTQYATGQVEMQNPENMTKYIVTPNYKSTSLVVLATKDQLQKNLQKGMSFLTHVGATFQSPVSV